VASIPFTTPRFRFISVTRRRVPAIILGALVFIGLVVACALFSSRIAPMSPSQQDLLLGATPPGNGHLLGTDQLGRDVLSRIVYGSRTALIGPTLVALGGFTIAVLLGLPAGYLGGRVDTLVMRWVDLMYSLPSLLITVVIVGILGGGYALAVLLLIVLFSPADTRIVRAEALRQRSLPYIEALRTLGVSRRRIIFRHIGPNALPILVAYVFLDFGFALVALSGLSFLGVGVAPGDTDWGRMLFENRTILFVNPWAAIAPGVAIVLTAVSMNLVGDWLYEHAVRSRGSG
jgi:peptide/nickel transport system permease protein